MCDNISPFFRAGKGDSEDVENDDHLIPACKENWEHPGTSAVLVAPNHRLPTMQTRQQSKQFTKSLNSTGWFIRFIEQQMSNKENNHFPISEIAIRPDEENREMFRRKKLA